MTHCVVIWLGHNIVLLKEFIILIDSDINCKGLQLNKIEMLLFIPHSFKLNRIRQPWVSYSIVLICMVVFAFQYHNETQLNKDIAQFCNEIESHAGDIHAMNKMVTDNYLCQLMIKRIEQRPDLSTKEIIDQYFWFADHSVVQIETMAAYVDTQYSVYANKYTPYLKKELVYFPASPDPVRMISSSVAHSNILHIVGNLIFFLAFAPALEILIARTWVFLTVCLATVLTTSLAYSMSVLLGQEALPALGLSGVVMGMIGLFAALMPFEKIKVFVWVLFYIKNIQLSAWVLAVWYIGWDSLDLILGIGDPAVNLIAHVSGGVMGYVLGYFWLRKRIEKD